MLKYLKLLKVRQEEMFSIRLLRDFEKKIGFIEKQI
jgi:hypothetical protein